MSGGPEPLLVAAKVWVLALSLALFGSACFSVYAGQPRRPRGGSAVAWSAPIAVALGIAAWLAILARDMTGAAGLPGPAEVAAVATDTGFGRALAAALACSLLLAAGGAARRAHGWPSVALSGALLCCLALVGHAAAGVGASGGIRMAAMALHLLAAGAWLGGLPRLLAELRRGEADAPMLLGKFSRMAVLAVLVAIGSGLISILYVVIAAGGGLGPGYLRALGVKLALVAGLLGVAGLNRFWLTPRIVARPGPTLRALSLAIAGEQMMALGLVSAAAWLGQLDPSM